VDEDRKPGADGTGDLSEEPASSSARPSSLPQPTAAADEDGELGSHAQLPRRVRRRLDESAEAWFRARAETTDDLPPVIEKIVIDRKAQRRGWYAAAVCLVLAIAGWWPRLAELGVDAANGISPLQADVERGREYLLKTSGAHLGRWSWSHESGVAAKVHGEVIWDGARQQGYLTLAGLQSNAETGRQYQLWIFDGTRDDRYPVDGGVFDVPPGDQPVTIPIRPALKVSQPMAFAVTLEPAGGVVVSDRQHLMALARVGTR